MNPIEFRRAPDAEPEVFACGECGRIWPNATDRSVAEMCCAPRICDCGEVMGKGIGGWTKCSTCRERGRFERAERVSLGEYDGPVWDPHNDRGFASVDEWLDWYDGEEGEPTYAYCGLWYGPPTIDPDRIIESLQSDSHEEWEPDAEAELREFCTQWNAKQTGRWWEEDSSRAVVVRGVRE